MKTNTTLIIVLAIFIVIIAGLFYVSSSKNSSLGLQNSQNSQILAPNYITYTPAALAKAKERGRTVLFFWAPWCGTCSFLDDELRKRSSELPSDLTVLRVNYDTQSDLKAKYQIVYQHTLVQIDKNGNEVTKWSGGGIDAFKQQLKQI